MANYITSDLYILKTIVPTPSTITVIDVTNIHNGSSYVPADLAAAIFSANTAGTAIRINLSVPNSFMMSSISSTFPNITYIEIGDPTNQNSITIHEAAFDSFYFTTSFPNLVTLIIHQNVSINTCGFGLLSEANNCIFNQLTSLIIGGQCNENNSFQFGSNIGNIWFPSLQNFVLLSTCSTSFSTFQNTYFGNSTATYNGITTTNFTFSAEFGFYPIFNTPPANLFSPQITVSFNGTTITPSVSTNFQSILSSYLLYDQFYDNFFNNPITMLQNPNNLGITAITEPFGDLLIPSYISTPPYYSSCDLYISNDVLSLPIATTTINANSLGTNTPTASQLASAIASASGSALKINVNIPDNFLSLAATTFSLPTSLEFGGATSTSPITIGQFAFDISKMNSTFTSGITSIIIHPNVLMNSSAFGTTSNTTMTSLKTLTIGGQAFLPTSTYQFGDSTFTIALPELENLTLLSTSNLNTNTFTNTSFGKTGANAVTTKIIVSGQAGSIRPTFISTAISNQFSTQTGTSSISTNFNHFITSTLSGMTLSSPASWNFETQGPYGDVTIPSRLLTVPNYIDDDLYIINYLSYQYAPPITIDQTLLGTISPTASELINAIFNYRGLQPTIKINVNIPPNFFYQYFSLASNQSQLPFFQYLEIGDPTSTTPITIGEWAFDLTASPDGNRTPIEIGSITIHKNVLMDSFCFGSSYQQNISIYPILNIIIGGGYVSSVSQYQFGSTTASFSSSVANIAILSTASLNKNTFINFYFSGFVISQENVPTNIIISGNASQYLSTPNPFFIDHFTEQTSTNTPEGLFSSNISSNFQKFIECEISGNTLGIVSELWGFSNGTYGDIVIPFLTYVPDDTAILDIHVDSIAYLIDQTSLSAIPSAANFSSNVLPQDVLFQNILIQATKEFYALGQAIIKAASIKPNIKIIVDIPNRFILQYLENFNDGQSLLSALSNIQYLEIGDGINQYLIQDLAFTVFSSDFSITSYFTNLTLLIIHNGVVLGDQAFALTDNNNSNIPFFPALQRLILGCSTSALGQYQFGVNFNSASVTMPQLVHLIFLSTTILNTQNAFQNLQMGTAFLSLASPEPTRFSVMSSKPNNSAITTQHIQFIQNGLRYDPVLISSWVPTQPNGSSYFQNFLNGTITFTNEFNGDILTDTSILYDVTTDISSDLTSPLQIWDFNSQGSYGDNIPQPPPSGFSQSYTVSSTAPIGTYIGIILISKTDIPGYTGAPLGFIDTSNPSQPYFSISSSGIISLAQKLSLSFQSLIIPIAVYENDTAPVLIGNIIISTSNTTNPSISISNNQIFTIKNNAPIGSFIGAISANDPGTERFTFNSTSGSPFFSISASGTISTIALLNNAPKSVNINITASALNGIAISASQSITITIVQTFNAQTFNAAPTIGNNVIFGQLSVEDDINDYLFEIINQPNSGPQFALTPLFTGANSVTEISNFATNITAISHIESLNKTVNLPPNNCISIASGTLISGNTYTITIRAINQSTMVHDDAIISIVGQNGPFAIIQNQVFTINSSQTNIGSVGYDNPSGGAVIFSALSSSYSTNPDISYFSISPSGALSVVTMPPPNMTQYIEVKATASNNQSDIQLITIVTIGNAPQIQNQTFHITTVTAPNEIIGTIFVSDPDGNQVYLEITNDTGDALNFALVNEDGEGSTFVSTNSNPYGNFSLVTTSIFPTESISGVGGSIITLDITATSSIGISSTATVTVKINEYQHPAIDQDQNFYIKKDLASGSFVGYIGAIDPNGGSLTFTDETVYTVNNPQLFTIQSSGTIFTKADLTLDTQTLTINVTNSGGLTPLSGTSTIVINMLSVLLNQTFEVNSTALPEKVFASMLIDGNAHDYFLTITVNSTPDFTLDADTGNLSFTGELGPVGTSYIITVTATKNTNHNVIHTAQMIIVVSLDDTFSIVPDQTFTISTAQMTVGNISYNNPTSGSVAFSPLPNNSLFSLGSTGLLTVNGANPGSGTYTINIVANNMTPVPVVIIILTNDTIIQNAEFTISSYYGINKTIGTIFASDRDGLPITLSVLSSTPSIFLSSFSISDNNQLQTSSTFISLPIGTISLAIEASDVSTISGQSIGGIAQGTIIIQVVASNFEVPNQTLLVNNTALAGDTFGPIVVTNPDNVVISFALSTTSVFTINPTSGVLTITNLIGFQAQNSFQLIVTVTSSDGVIKTATLTISQTVATSSITPPSSSTSIVVWVALGVLGLISIAGFSIAGIALSKIPATPPIPETPPATPKKPSFDAPPTNPIFKGTIPKKTPTYTESTLKSTVPKKEATSVPKVEEPIF